MTAIVTVAILCGFAFVLGSITTVIWFVVIALITTGNLRRTDDRN